MIKNLIFDIGNVILNFKLEEVLPKYTNDKDEQQFIIDNIINSPEWLLYSLIDTGYITKEEAIKIVQDRTNHTNDNLISSFWNTYNNYSHINKDVINLIINLKNKGYKIYLLSNINEHTCESIKKQSNLFDIVDGYVLSYLEHQIKPYTSIYKTLLNRYSLSEKECLFIDDNQNNIKTASSLGILSIKVEPGNYESIENNLKELKII